MLGTLFFASRFSAACKDQQKNAIILQKNPHLILYFRLSNIHFYMAFQGL